MLTLSIGVGARAERRRPNSQAEVVDMILTGSPSDIDPALLEAFRTCHAAFDDVFRAAAEAG